MHPVLRLLHDAVEGTFPAEDGLVQVVPSWRPDLSAVVSFTAHTLIVTDTPEVLRDVRVDAYGTALHPAVLATLAGYPAQIGVIDATLAARGAGGPEALVASTEHDEHPRVLHARSIRDEVQVYVDPERPNDALVTLGTGLAGRWEISIELLTGATSGTGRRLITAARSLVPQGDPLFAAVAPGNARSLRAFLAAGFVPVCSEVIIRHLGGRVGS